MASLCPKIPAMDKILVSACLLGDRCRYDGEGGDLPILRKLQKKYDLVPFCPEVEAGLPVPRSPAEILRGKVVSKEGKDLTKEYDSAAEKAVRLCRLLGIHLAILKEGSPACGPRKIHDGTFMGGKVPGMGVTARALVQSGVKVYSDEDALGFLLEEREERKDGFLRGKEERKGKSHSYGKRRKEEEGALFRLSPGKDGDGKPRGARKGKPFRKKEGDGASEGRPSYGKKEFRGKDFHGKKPSYGKKAPFARKEGEDPSREKEGRPSYGKKDFHGKRPSFGKKPSYGKKPFHGDRPQREGAMRPEGGKPHGKKDFHGKKPSYGKKDFHGKRGFEGKKGRSFQGKPRKREG